MKAVRLTISKFRGIKSAELLFDGHTCVRRRQIDPLVTALKKPN